MGQHMLHINNHIDKLSNEFGLKLCTKEEFVIEENFGWVVFYNTEKCLNEGKCDFKFENPPIFIYDKYKKSCFPLNYTLVLKGVNDYQENNGYKIEIRDPNLYGMKKQNLFIRALNEIVRFFNPDRRGVPKK